MTRKKTDKEIELCMQINMQIDSCDNKCSNYSDDNSRCIDETYGKCDRSYKLLDLDDVVEILNKYYKAWQLRRVDYKLEDSKKNYFVVNCDKITIEKDYSFYTTGDTPLEAGLRAVLKIAEIMEKSPNKLLEEK